MTENDRAIAAAQAAALAAIRAGQQIVRLGEGPWAGAVLAAAERFAFEVRFYEQDIERRRADEAALKKEQGIG